MKYLFFLLLIIGCSTKQESSLETKKLNDAVDSLISISERNIDSASVKLTESDSAVSRKIDQTVQKIEHLENEVKQLKEENNELKGKLNDADDAGKPFRIRTISNN